MSRRTDYRAKPRIRWGVQYRFDYGWRTIGTSWIDSPLRIPSYVDQWPASYQTRAEARAWVTRKHAEYALRSDCCHDWRFRVVKLSIQVRVVR